MDYGGIPVDPGLTLRCAQGDESLQASSFRISSFVLSIIKTGHFYFGGNRTFLFWLDTVPLSAVTPK